MPAQSTQKQDLLTIREVSEILRITPKTIYALTNRGAFPTATVDLGPRLKRWRKSDIIRLLEQQNASISSSTSK